MLVVCAPDPTITYPLPFVHNTVRVQDTNDITFRTFRPIIRDEHSKQKVFLTYCSQVGEEYTENGGDLQWVPTSTSSTLHSLELVDAARASNVRTTSARSSECTKHRPPRVAICRFKRIRVLAARLLCARKTLTILVAVYVVGIVELNASVMRCETTILWGKRWLATFPWVIWQHTSRLFTTGVADTIAVAAARTVMVLTKYMVVDCSGFPNELR